MRPRSDAATDGDRLERVICDGGPDQTQAEPNHALLRGHDREVIHRLDCACGTRLFRGAQVPGKGTIATAAQRPVVIGCGGPARASDPTAPPGVAPRSSPPPATPARITHPPTL